MFKKKDIIIISCLSILYFFLSTFWLNWDHLELADGYGSDPFNLSEAIAYSINWSDSWRFGYNLVLQGYGIVLSLFYRLLFFFSWILGKTPNYEAFITVDSGHGLPNIVTKISTMEGRIFFYMGARLFSSILGWLYVIFVYKAGKDFFADKKIGFIAALFVLSCYSFILTTQLARWNMADTFFFFLAFISSIHLMNRPGWRNYIWCGIFCGIALSMIQTNGIALVVLLIVHILILKEENKLRFTNVLFDKRLMLSLFFAMLSFITLNPRFIQYDFIPKFIYGQKLHLSLRNEMGLYCHYEGIFTLFSFSRDNLGLTLSLVLLLGFILSLTRFKKWQIPYLFVIIFFSLFNYLGQEIHFFLNLLPALAIYAAKGYLDTYQWLTARYKFMVSKSASIVLIVVIFFCCLPGIIRTIAQNLINSEISNELKASLWIDENIENKDQIYYLYIPGRVFSAKTAIPPHEKNAPINLADLFPVNLPKFSTAEYAIINESQYLYDLFAKDGYYSYSPSRKMLSPYGTYYGFKESTEEYYQLLEKNADLIKEFEEGTWRGMDQMNYLGVRFHGVPLKQMKDFFLEKNFRSHGLPVKIYKLNNKFKSELYNEIGIPLEIQEIGNKNGWEQSGLGKIRISNSDIQYNSELKEVCITLSLVGNGKVAYGEWKFQFLHNYLANVLYVRKKSFKSIWQGIKRELSGISSKDMREDYIVRELVAAGDVPVTKKYILKVSENMPSGEVVVRLLGGGLEDIQNLGKFYYGK